MSLIVAPMTALMKAGGTIPQAQKCFAPARGGGGFSAGRRGTKVRKTQPAAYMKICALLVPREMKLEHSGGVKAMTDEQLERALEAIESLMVQRGLLKVVDGKVLDAPVET